MRCDVIKAGFWKGDLLQPGQELTLDRAEQFSPNWMQAVDWTPPDKPKLPERTPASAVPAAVAGSEAPAESSAGEVETESNAEKIRAAIDGLNPVDDALWTKSGAPNCNVLTERCGFTVTRAALEQVAAGASRPAVPEAPEG